MSILMVPPASPSGVLRFEWIDSNNVVRDFTRDTSPQIFVPAGSTGLGAPEFEVAAGKFPFAAGTYVTHINTRERVMEIPIIVTQEALGDVILTMQDLHGWFDTGNEESLRPGSWRITRPDNSIRKVACYYQHGLEDMAEGGPNWAKYVLNFYAPDPAPVANSTTVVPAKSVAQAASFAIINEGTLNAYPIWTVTGPYININAYNSTYNESLYTNNLVVPAGQTVIFDTRPSELRPGLAVYDNLGANRIASVVNDAKFWHLRPGLNNIAFTFGANMTAATTVQLSYLPRYRSLLR